MVYSRLPLHLHWARGGAFLNLCPDAQARLHSLTGKLVGRKKREEKDKHHRCKRRKTTTFILKIGIVRWTERNSLYAFLLTLLSFFFFFFFVTDSFIFFQLFNLITLYFLTWLFFFVLVNCSWQFWYNGVVSNIPRYEFSLLYQLVFFLWY